MPEIENPSLAQLRALLESSQEVHFQAEGRAEIYACVGRTYYPKLSGAGKDLVRGYVKKRTGPH